MRHYNAYGLHLASSLEFPELTEISGDTKNPNILIECEVLDGELPPNSGKARGCYYATSDVAYLWYPNIGYFMIEKGVRIVADVDKDLDKSVLRHFILGVSLGIALHQRGHLTLHASGVNIGGKAVAFIGDKYQGKTTTASAFYAHGHPLITDDTIVLSTEDTSSVLPGFPQLKLRPEVIASLNLEKHELEDLAGERHLHQARSGFDLAPLPLHCLYVLDWGEDFGVDRLSGHDCFLQLVNHSYALRFLGKSGATAAHFKQVSRLYNRVPIYKLKRPRNLDRLPELVQFVRGHL